MISAEDIRVTFGDVIMITMRAIGVPVAFVEIARRFAAIAIRPVNCITIECVADQRGMLSRLILKRRFHADRIFVIVIPAHRVGMTAT